MSSFQLHNVGQWAIAQLWATENCSKLGICSLPNIVQLRTAWERLAQHCATEDCSKLGICSLPNIVLLTSVSSLFICASQSFISSFHLFRFIRQNTQYAGQDVQLSSNGLSRWIRLSSPISIENVRNWNLGHQNCSARTKISRGDGKFYSSKVGYSSRTFQLMGKKDLLPVFFVFSLKYVTFVKSTRSRCATSKSAFLERFCCFLQWENIVIVWLPIGTS